MTGRRDHLRSDILTGSVALVSGATGDIGSAISRELGLAGATVVVSSRRQAAVDELAASLEESGIRVVGIAADACDPDHVERLFDQVESSFGALHILVNAVGGSFSERFKRGHIASMSATDVMECLRLNVLGAVLCSQRAASLMKAGGAIVNLSSMAATRPAEGFSVYGASKAALEYLTRSMAIEFGPMVRVNALAAGPIETGRAATNRPPGRLERQLGEMVIQRLGTPADVARGVLYLVDPMNSWTTGAILHLDGGYRGAWQ